MSTVPRLDSGDLAVLEQLVQDPRIQVTALAERLGVARNTAQARLDRLQRSGVLRAGGREVELAAIGFEITAFVTIEVSHRELDAAVVTLRTVPQLLEVHEITGRGDLWCRVVARDMATLQKAIHTIHRIRGVLRTETSLALHERVPYRIAPLLTSLR